MNKAMLFAGAAALASMLSLSTANAQIRIATAGPMTGQYAAFGAQMKAGAEQAVADINAKGGVLGQKLVLEIGDDACDPKQAVSVANQLASKGVKVVAGHFCSSSSIPASKVYTEEGVLQITPASTNPKYTDEGAWNTFRVCGRDDQQGAVAGKYIATKYKGKKVAILHDNSTYGKGLAEETKKAFNVAGGKETLFEAYTPGEKDYSAVVSRLKSSGIEVIYLGGYHTEGGLILRQAKQQGMKVTLIGGDALVTNEFWQITGDSGQGTLMTFAPDPRARPANASLVNDFKKKNIDPEGYVLYTYAAIQVWADAAKKANSVDPKKVAAELKASAQGWSSAVGNIAFDKKGDPKAAGYVMFEWKNGSYAQQPQS